MATCKLCLKQNKLRNSHIIPEFVYKPIYDKKHRFDVIAREQNVRNDEKQKGLREYLLCQVCETKLSKYERYVSLVLDNGLNVKQTRNGNYVKLEGIDYEKYKLFALSILWRASVTSLPFFKSVKLGHHEEVLRKFLYSGSVPKEHEYPFFVAPLVHTDNSLIDAILAPSKSRLLEHRIYRFVFSGMLRVFVVSKTRIPDKYQDICLTESGCMYMNITQ